MLFHVALEYKKKKRVSDISISVERSRVCLPRADSNVRRQWRIQGSLAMEKLRGEFSFVAAAFFYAPLRPGYASDRIRSLHLPANIGHTHIDFTEYTGMMMVMGDKVGYVFYG